jgi:hypothetical protein
MSEETDKFPAVHIDRRHQKAPKEAEADKAVRLAAEEIDKGQWTLPAETATEMGEIPGVALRAGTADFIDPAKNPWGQKDFDATDQSLVLGEHPRVLEALQKMEEQKSEARIDGQKYAELAAMQHETVENSRRRQRWDGQERWQEEDVLESRKGLILNPLEFYKRLMEEGLESGGNLAVVEDYPTTQLEWVDGVLKRIPCYVRAMGTGRILLGFHIKKIHPADKSGRIAVLVMAHSDNPVQMPGHKTPDEEPVQVATLQAPFSTEWMVMKFDEFGVPRTPRFIGWRTALLALIRNGVVTAQEAHRAFPVGTGPQASWYRQQLFEFQGGA